MKKVIRSLNFVDREIFHSLTYCTQKMQFLSAIGLNGVSLQHPFVIFLPCFSLTHTYVCMHHLLLSYPYRKLRKRHKDATNDSAKRSKEVKSPSEFSLPDLDGSSETRKPEIGKGYI